MRVPGIQHRFNFLLSRSWIRRASLPTRTLSSETLPSQSCGGLPRFHSQILPSSEGEIVRIEGDEFWHMTKVLRLGVNARVELFNGTGGLVEGCIQCIDRNALDVVALEEPKVICPEGIQWHIFAAFSTLKGGRADWLIEKCTELGASSVTPLLVERSPTIADNRVDRLERVILAAIKQCKRLHKMTLNPPMKLHNILPFPTLFTNSPPRDILCSRRCRPRRRQRQPRRHRPHPHDLVPSVSQSKLSFLAAAESTPLLSILSLSSAANSGLLIVGPEGDFTEEEVKLMVDAGAMPVGLGPCRLRVETATIAMLSTLMLWSDALKLEIDENCAHSSFSSN